MTKFRWLVSFLMLLATSAAYGDALDVEYLGQWPPFDVIPGEPVKYTFENTNVDDTENDGPHGIGTGMQIRVNGVLIPPGDPDTIFTSSLRTGNIPDCEEDPNPEFSDTWACGNLDGLGDSQEYSFTWTPPGIGTYVVNFLAFCQEWPMPAEARLCAVNGTAGGTGTAAIVTTVVDPDTDGDGVGDPTDPDDDNDGIPDDLDEQPLVPSNICSESGFDNATLGMAITEDLTCAARVSIQVEGTTEVWGSVSPPAHLRLIAPTIRFEDGFAVQQGGLLSVISANPCPDCGGYEIGDEGPAGGIVFYVTDGGWHGLEAAPEDQAIPWDSVSPWGCYSISFPGAWGTGIGTGAQNTAAILEGCRDRPIAASLAFNYSLNGFDDWFLPSKDELRQLYLQRTIVRGFTAFYYWSSSAVEEFPTSGAWVQHFGDGEQSISDRTYNQGVRAVRSF